jgi:hypothetical protein
VERRCKYHPAKRCWHGSCSLIAEDGSVSVCPLFRGGDFFARRRVGVVLRPLFSKHSKGGSQS